MAALVIGGTGGHGSTGRVVIHALLEHGVSVRALVHRADGRAQELQKLGCQTIVADMLDLASLRTAFDGVKTCYFTYPIRSNLVEAAANVALVAKEVQIQQLVNNSMVVTMDISPSPFARQMFLAEQIFAWAGLPVVNLRGGFFYENLLRYSRHQLLESGRIRWPMGDGNTKLAWIAASDVGQAAAELLLSPKQGSHIIYLTGPEAMTFHEVAQRCSEALDKLVVYEEEDMPTFMKLVNDVEHNNEVISAHLTGMSGAFRVGKSFGRTTDSLKQLTGTTGMTLTEFVRKHSV